MKSRTLPSRAPGHSGAFTLVEVVLALAVTAFCILTILGLLPVGANTAVESRRATRASYLAEQVVSDLRSSSFTNASILYQNSGSLAQLLPTINMSVASTNYLACDAQENVLAPVPTQAQYASGMNSANVDYLVQITVLPSALTTNLATVSVEVSAPAQGALSSRNRYGFMTMIGNRQ